jgi:hypothetical protein
MSDDGYGEEGALDLSWGGQLRFPTWREAHLCTYVRVVDSDGHEIAYWNMDEWREDPGLVMGAIMGLAQHGPNA